MEGINGGKMEKIAFVMKIKPERVNDYIEIHKKGSVWPQVLENIDKSGMKKMVIFMLENNAIVYVEAEDTKKAFDYLGKQPTTIEWNEVTAPFMDTQPRYGQEEAVEMLQCVFDFENGKQLN